MADMSYAEELRAKAVGQMTRTNATRDQVVEGSREDGTRYQERTDQAGTTITRETAPDGRERQHVRVRLG
ncbi:hypothetical protein ACFFV7_50930 [Nonomuraea spiralis]|uniref:Uncharacterized protein n=1 Tax=Nonomuraea spiralis TaxID=46182 RepID=A0ABV5IYM8_9ACTN|nr:hypothetical protein [Nonomuraea spiralis]GGS88548.1 hypothetical protein GCM10010176_035400 [Nonomuraea spiralis]